MPGERPESPDTPDFGALAGEFATADGTNEQVLAALRGAFDQVERALDEAARRLEGG